MSAEIIDQANELAERRLEMTMLIIWIIWGNTALQLNKYTVSSERLPRAFDGCKIAHISDLHNTEICLLYTSRGH